MPYHSMREYDCPADYYDAGNLGSVAPSEIRARRKRESDDRMREREAFERRTSGMGFNE